MKGRCPRPLDDGDVDNDLQLNGHSGGARRDRTADLLHAMQALSQLSYSPFFKKKVFHDYHLNTIGNLELDSQSETKNA